MTPIGNSRKELNNMTPNKADNMINEYLEKCYTEPETEIYSFISNKYEDLVCTYGYQLISNVMGACSIQMLSTDEEEYKKAIAKLTKDQIFEIAATVSFLAGMAFAEMSKDRR